MANLIRSCSVSQKSKYFCCFLFLIILLIGPIGLNAQARYRGKIVKAHNGKAAVGARLRIDNSNEITYTDIMGVFVFYAGEKDSFLVVLDDKRYAPLEFMAFPNKDVMVVIEKKPPNWRPKTKFAHPEKVNLDFSKTVISPNRNEISNPSNAALLLQHNVPGLTVTRPGNDPNAPFQLYNRGISSVANRNTPLIIIDGMPEMSLERLNPEDIASISITKNAIGGAKYGMLGGAGVIEVQTKMPGSAMSGIHYHSSLGVATEQRGLPILDADAYRKYKPQHDEGASTDWIKTITQTGVSHRHHLSYLAGDRKKGVYASLGYHDEEGILKQSGFKQGNARLNFRGTSKNGKTKVSLTSAYTQRDAELSNPEAFSAAVFYNPTIPVYDANGELTVKPNFQSTTANPFGQILLSKNLVRTQEWVGGFQSKTNIFANKSLELQLSFRRRNLINGQKSANSSRFYHNRFDRKHFFGNIQTKNNHTFGNIKIKRYTGFETSVLFEKHTHFDERLDELSDLNFKNLQNPKAKWDDLFTEEEKHPKIVLSAFTGGEIELHVFRFFAGARYDRLYADEKGIGKLFFHGGIGSDLKKIMDFAWLDKANLTLGFGKTGLLLIGNGIFRSQFNHFLAGEYLSRTYAEEGYINESKTEIDLQLDFSFCNERLNATVNLYDNLLTDQDFNSFQEGEIGNKGLEAYFSYRNKKGKKLQWEAGLGFFTNKSITYRYSLSNEKMTLANAISSFDFGEIWLEPYGQAGQIYGMKTDGTIFNGKYVESLNPDNTTFQGVIGHVKPDFGLTVTNGLKWKNWDMAFKFRSLVGHHIYNFERSYYERISSDDQNILKTKYFNEERTRSHFEILDIFLENASFLKLDYLTIGYNPILKKGGIRFYLAGHDLLTITGYTGIDPEPVYQRGNVALAGGSALHDNSRYYRSRQVVFGVQLSL